MRAKQRPNGFQELVRAFFWTDSHSGTDGCIAMEEANLKQVLSWLDSKHNPTIGIFSSAVYKELKQAWQLP